MENANLYKNRMPTKLVRNSRNFKQKKRKTLGRRAKSVSVSLTKRDSKRD